MDLTVLVFVVALAILFIRKFWPFLLILLLIVAMCGNSRDSATIPQHPRKDYVDAP